MLTFLGLFSHLVLNFCTYLHKHQKDSLIKLGLGKRKIIYKQFRPNCMFPNHIKNMMVANIITNIVYEDSKQMENAKFTFFTLRLMTLAIKISFYKE